MAPLTFQARPARAAVGPKPVSAAAQPAPQQQAPAPARPQGLINQALTSVSRPLDFQAAPQVQQSPVTPYSGPMALSYQGQRVEAQPRIAAPQANERIQPSQTFTFDPASGQYYSSPGAQANALPSIEQFRPDMASVESATYQRGYNQIQPHLQRQREELSQRLANQGLPVGSEAHTAEMNRLEQSQNAALENLALSSVGAGRQEHSRLTGLASMLNSQEFGQAMQRLGFDANEARRQFAERLGATQFNAAEAGRGFGEQLAGSQADFAQRLGSKQFDAGEAARLFQQQLASENQYFNQRLAGDQFAADQSRFGAQFDAGRADNRFGQGMQSRNQWLQEQMLGRQLPMQEIGQLLGLAGQVSSPTFQPMSQYSPMPVNYLGHRAQQGNQMASLFGGLGGAALGGLFL